MSAVKWASVLTSANPSSSYRTSMAYDGTNIILFGGSSSETYMSETWKWNGTTWTQVFLDTSPSGRNGASMAYDGTNIILFGGFDGNRYNDTWKWNGSNWTQLSPVSSPSVRSAASMAYDGSNIILFGGFDGYTCLNDTWKWDGSNWTQLSPESSPPVRSAASMVYDGTNIILFGGANNYDSLNDTWKWTGTTWTQVFPDTSPSTRADASMAYDGTNIILFGGGSSETWKWTETNWIQLSPAASPPVRSASSMAYDGSNLIVFGGYSGGLVTDTWRLCTVPGAPVGTVTPGNKQATVSWKAPNNGGLPITGYTVTVTPGNKTVTSTKTSTTITGLTAGTLYTFAVTATNAVGVSQSMSKTATTWAVPGAPAGVTATAGKGSATVSWKAPANGGSPITGYTVTVIPGNKTVTSTKTSTTISGLSVGKKYTFAVTAKNIVGTSPSASSKPVTLKASFPITNVIRKPIAF